MGEGPCSSSFRQALALRVKGGSPPVLAVRGAWWSMRDACDGRAMGYAFVT